MSWNPSSNNVRSKHNYWTRTVSDNVYLIQERELHTGRFAVMLNSDCSMENIGKNKEKVDCILEILMKFAASR